ncbi:MAG TPA: sulfur carrier protein ThiS [Candidatus Polarisedimenticolia bacterium]|nr:sulfur carrier protein ThiS [Candidatus Polarisedimenticolia bacterium]
MTIILNGQERMAPAGSSVLALLETLGLAPGRVAVELNGVIVRRDTFARAILSDSDRIEVVHFVGGG